MKIYHLIIAYNDKTEEIEYILETVDEVDDEHVKLTHIGTIDLEEYFDKDTLREILQNYEMGEA